MALPDLTKYQLNNGAVKQNNTATEGKAGTLPSLDKYQLKAPNKNSIQAPKNNGTEEPIFSFDADVLNSVATNWRAGWDYNLFDPEDMDRKAKGVMPKAVEQKYNMEDPVDRVLYSHGLPSKKEKFSEKYQKAEEAAKKESKKEEEPATTVDYETAETKTTIFPKSPAWSEEDKQALLEEQQESRGRASEFDLKEAEKRLQNLVFQREQALEYAPGVYTGALGAARVLPKNVQELDREIKNLKREISNMRFAKERNDKLSKFEELANEPNFERLSRQGAEMKGDFLHGYINDAPGMREKAVEIESKAGGTGGDIYEKYQEMTPDELKVYNAVYAKNGANAAHEYLKEIDPILNERFVKRRSNEIAEIAKENPVAASVGSVADSLGKGIGYVYSAVQGLRGEYADPNSVWFSPSISQKAVRDAVSDDMSPVGKFLYQTGMSIADFAAASPMGHAAVLFMGTGTAADTTRDALERGASQEEALTLGTLAGAAEIVFEKVSLDNLIKMSAPGAKGAFIKNVLKQAGIEASEEVATEIANKLADAVVMGDLSQYNMLVQEYMARDMSEQEAKAKASIQSVLDVALAGLGGALSGGVTGSFAGGIGNYRTAQIGRENRADAQNLVQQGLSMPQDTLAYELAQRGAKNDLQIGQQYLANQHALQDQTRAALQNDLNTLQLSQRDARRVMMAYDSLSDGKIKNARQSLNKLQNSVSKALSVRAENDAQINVVRAEASAKLDPLYSAMQTAAQTGNVQAFQEAQAKYMAEYGIQQAKGEAAKVKAENQAQDANRLITETAEEIEEERLTEIAFGERMDQGGVQNGGEVYQRLQQGVPGYVERPQPATYNQPIGSEDQGAYAGNEGTQGGNRGNETGRGRVQTNAPARAKWGRTVTPEAEEVLQRHAETVFEATGQRPDVRIVNEVDAKTAELLDEAKAFTNVDAFLYESDDAYSYGMATTEGAFVRNTGNAEDMVRQYGHEAGHLTPRVMDLGLKAVEKIGQAQVDAYAAYRNAHILTPDDADIKRELVADVFGGFIYEATTGKAMPTYFGLSRDAVVTLHSAYEDAMGVTETETGEVVDEVGRVIASGDTEYSRVGRKEVSREEAKNLPITDPDNLERYRKEVDGVFDGSLPSGQAVLLGQTPSILTEHGMPKLTLYMEQSTARKVAYPSGYTVGGINMGGKHNLGMSVLKQLPYQLADPAAIIRNPQKNKFGYDSYIVLTEWRDQLGRPVVIPIHINAQGAVGLENRIASVFQADYIETLLGENNSNVLYSKNKENIRKLLSNGKQLPEAMADDVLIGRISQTEKKINNEYSRIKFSDEYGDSHSYSMPAITERTDKAVKENGGGKYRADFNLGGKKMRLESDSRQDLEEQLRQMKQDYTMGHLSESATRLREARRLFKDGYSMKEYYESGFYDHQIGRLLRKMRLDAGFSEGGALSTEQTKANIQNLNQWKNMHALTNTLSSPQRLFQELGNWRNEEALGARAENYLEGKHLEDTYFYYVLEQGAKANLWMQEKKKAVADAYGKGDRITSVLTQMLGEELISETAAKNAIYDGNHMVVRDNHGTFVFDRHGQLKAVQSGDQILLFTKNYYKAIREANKEIRELAEGKDKKLTPAERNNRIREVEMRARSFKPMEKQGHLTVMEGGNSIRVMLGTNVIAEIKNGKRPDIEKVKELKNTLTAAYDEMFEEQNAALVENGQKPINKRKNYFPHQGRENGGIQNFIETLRGDAQALPTEISGQTGMFKPGKPFTAHLLERMGTQTEFNAVRGFNNYVQSAADLIFYTPAIQRLRQLESAVRENSVGTQNSDFVSWLQNYTNTLANKKSEFDRGFEGAGGRSVYTITDRLTRYFGAASVAGNIASALSNNISFLSALPTLDPRFLAKGMKETVLNGIRSLTAEGRDGFAEQIPFLVRRFYGYENIMTSKLERAKEKGSKALGIFFLINDRLAVETAARAKYAEYMSKGHEHAEAVKETDKYLNQIFSDRSKGMGAAVFNIRAIKPFVQFQQEALNQMSHFRDIDRIGIAEQIDGIIRKNGGNVDGINWAEPENLLKGAGWKEGIRKLAYLLLMALWGELITRPFMGRDQTWNVIGMGRDFARDAKEEGAGQALLNFGTTVLEQLPFSNMITPIITGEDAGRVPLMGGVDKARNLVQTLADDEAGKREKNLAVLGAATAFVPGGAQTSKTIKGIDAAVKGGVYTDNGRLKHPVDDKDIVWLILNGPSSTTPEGYDWQTDILSEKATANYEKMRENGIEPWTAYNLLNDMPPQSNAAKIGHIATFDANGDGEPDLDPEEMNIVAKILEIDTENQSVPNYARAKVKERIEKIQNDEDLTPEEQQKKIEEENLQFFLTILGN